jgi:hypothetical protein
MADFGRGQRSAAPSHVAQTPACTAERARVRRPWPRDRDGGGALSRFRAIVSTTTYMHLLTIWHSGLHRRLDYVLEAGVPSEGKPYAVNLSWCL